MQHGPSRPVFRLRTGATSGRLDAASSNEVFALTRRMQHAKLKISFLVVTHDPPRWQRAATA